MSDRDPFKLDPAADYDDPKTFTEALIHISIRISALEALMLAAFAEISGTPHTEWTQALRKTQTILAAKAAAVMAKHEAREAKGKGEVH